jgi:hypothetical protein
MKQLPAEKPLCCLPDPETAWVVHTEQYAPNLMLARQPEQHTYLGGAYFLHEAVGCLTPSGALNQLVSALS